MARLCIVLVVLVATGSVAVRQKTTSGPSVPGVHEDYCFCASTKTGRQMAKKTDVFQVHNGVIVGDKCDKSHSCVDCASAGVTGKKACCEVQVLKGSLDAIPVAGSDSHGTGKCGQTSIKLVKYSQEDTCTCPAKTAKKSIYDGEMEFTANKACLPGTPCHICSDKCEEVFTPNSLVMVQNKEGTGTVAKPRFGKWPITVTFSDGSTGEYRSANFKNGEIKKVCEATPTGPSSASPAETGGTAATPRSNKVTDTYSEGVKKQWEGAQGYGSKGHERAAGTGTGGGVAGRYNPTSEENTNFGGKWVNNKRVESSNETIDKADVANYCYCAGGGKIGAEGSSFQIAAKRTPQTENGQVTGRESKYCEVCKDCAFGSNPCCDVVVNPDETDKQKLIKGAAETCGGPIKDPEFHGEVCNCHGAQLLKSGLYDEAKKNGNAWKCQPSSTCSDCSPSKCG